MFPLKERKRLSNFFFFLFLRLGNSIIKFIEYEFKIQSTHFHFYQQINFPYAQSKQKHLKFIKVCIMFLILLQSYPAQISKFLINMVKI